MEEDPADGRAARRRAGRGAREGQGAGLAPALGRGRQPARPAAAVQGPQAHGRAAVLRAGRGGVGAVPDEARARIASRRRRRWSTTGTTSRRSRGSGASSPRRRRSSARRSCRRRRRSSCSSTAAACSACAPATAAAAGTGRSSANFEPGSDITARVTILAEGTQGHLTGAALERFGLRGEQPAGVGARRQGGLEGREAARPGDPHDGLAAARGQQVPRVRRLVRLPDGRRHGHDRHGRRARLHATRSCRCTTCCRS